MGWWRLGVVGGIACWVECCWEVSGECFVHFGFGVIDSVYFFMVVHIDFPSPADYNPADFPKRL